VTTKIWSRKPPPLTPSQLFGANEAFAYAFASFLRQHEEEWRIRRVERFRPFDLHLAERQITLQGQIEAELLQRFLDLEDDPSLRVAPELLRAGEPLTAYLPVVAHEKRLHLDFRARDRKGHSLAVVNRFESARMTAVHLMAILIGDREITVGEARRLFVVLMTLAFQTPGAFEERIRTWALNRARDRGRWRWAFERARWGLGRSRPQLDTPDLLEWIAFEGNTFLPGLGHRVRGAVESYLEAKGTGEREPPEFPLADVPSLANYRTLERLLLHGIRDVFKTFVELAPLFAPRQRQPNEYTRAELMDVSHPERLATLVEQDALGGLDFLSQVLRDADDTTRHLYTELIYWRSYIPLEVTLGLPFTVELSETYPFGEHVSYPKQLASFVVGSWQYYPLPLKDAEGVHIEIEVPDPALQLRKSRVVTRIPETGETLRIPPIHIFGTVLRASERMGHYYSSRMRGDTPEDDWILPSLRARLKVRLTQSVALGHAFAAVAAAVAAAYVADLAVPRAIHEHRIPSDDLRIAAAVGAISLTISLWLSAVQHPRPITFKMLALPRLVLYAALATIVGSFAAYGVSRLLASHHPAGPPTQTTALRERLGVGPSAVGRIDGHARKASGAALHLDLRARRPARLAL
jgi:hypothetical protein